MNNELNTILDNFSVFMKESFVKIGDIEDKNKFFYKSEILDLIKYCNSNREIIDEVLLKIANEFDTYNELKANLICYMCGTLVEFGGNQDIIISHVIETFKEALMWVVSGITQKDEEKDDRKKVHIYVSFQIIDYLILASMTMLARSSLERERFRKDEDIQILLSAITPDEIKNIYYIQKMMELTDNLEMTVIHPDKKKGYKIKVDGVQNYFHLFTLLQGEFIEKVSDELGLGKALLNRNAIDIASGKKMPDEFGQVEDKAIFSYYIWTALSSDKTLSKNVPLEQWVYGELMPKNTPTILGEKIVLIGDNVMKERSWDGNFFNPLHDALKGQVSIVSCLTEVEVEEWLNTIVSEKSKLQEVNPIEENVKATKKSKCMETEAKAPNNEKGFKKFLKNLFNK